MARLVDPTVKVSTDKNGVERLAQDKVNAQVVGSPEVGTIEPGKESVKEAQAAGPVTKKERLAYIVMPEEDAAQFVKNTERLQAILKDPDLAQAIKQKGK